MWKIVLVSIAILIILIIIFLGYIGVFTKIIIQEKETGPFILVYEEHKGEYKGVAKIQDEIYYSLLNNQKIETFKGFGIYYDNPKEVPKAELRSIAGCILQEIDYDKIDSLKEEGYKIKEIPTQDSIVVKFPYKNTLSIMVGIIRVYPKIEKYIKENNLASNEIMEIYDIPSKKIIYLMRK